MLVVDASRSMAWTGDPARMLPKLAYVQRLIAALALLLLRQRDATGTDRLRRRGARGGPGAGPHVPLAPAAGDAGRPDARARAPPPSRRSGGWWICCAAADSWSSSPTCCSTATWRSGRSSSCAIAGTRCWCCTSMDPAELELAGPAEARFEDPETGQGVTLRPRDWAEAYRETVAGVVSAWRRACRAQRHPVPPASRPTRRSGSRCGAWWPDPPGRVIGLSASLGAARPAARGGAAAAAPHPAPRSARPSSSRPSATWSRSPRSTSAGCGSGTGCCCWCARCWSWRWSLAAAGPSAPLRRGREPRAERAGRWCSTTRPRAAAVVAGTPAVDASCGPPPDGCSRGPRPPMRCGCSTSDGAARRGSPAELARQLVDSLQPSTTAAGPRARRLTLAGEVLATDPRPGGIVVLSDLQATALAPATPTRAGDGRAPRGRRRRAMSA